jgi:hypothetical protein
MNLSQQQSLTMEQIQANASLLILAGSETTATLLGGVTYFLLKQPDLFDKLSKEVRSSFRNSEEITLLSVSKLPYMLACISEALRYAFSEVKKTTLTVYLDAILLPLVISLVGFHAAVLLLQILSCQRM